MNVLTLMPRFRQARRSLAALAERERLPRADVEAYQLERINRVWAHAVAHVPHYRTLAAELRLPARFDTLAHYAGVMPSLPKQTVAADPDAFLSERAERGSWKRTGGSTGRPMKVYWGAAAHREVLAARYRYYQAWDVDFTDRSVMLWGHSAALRPGLAGLRARLRGPVEDRIRRRLRLSTYELSEPTLQEYLRSIEQFRPTTLYGYSSSVHLLAKAAAAGFDCPELKLVTLTGEPSFQYIRDAVERHLRATATQEYGAAEAPIIATEMPDRTLRVREDLVFVETPPAAGGRHPILVTVLNNPSFPLLRYEMGDLASAPLRSEASGFAILDGVAGRVGDFVITGSGTPMHLARIDAFFKYEVPGVRRFRLRQQPDGAVRALIEADGPAFNSPATSAKLADLLEGRPVSVDVVETIATSPAGKHRLVVSEYPRPHDRPAPRPDGARPTPPASAPRPARGPALPRAQRLRELVYGPDLAFIMEAHNGLSARVVEEAGFQAIWASGLSISAALGVRDSNEASWTQVLEVLEFMSDATTLPILVDADTGYGNFNNVRRLVRKLEQRDIAGMGIEDKTFPKTNSFLRSETQPLADAREFAGRIAAGKDSQLSDDFMIIARVEALVAGWGMDEAMQRAELYHEAGADSILIHTASRTADEVLAFKEEWGDRLPVVIVPTRYYSAPTELFRQAGFAAVIWANHLMRSSLAAMQRTAHQIFEEESLAGVEERLAPLAEVFRIQGDAELAEAERRYLPQDEAALGPSTVEP